MTREEIEARYTLKTGELTQPQRDHLQREIACLLADLVEEVRKCRKETL